MGLVIEIFLHSVCHKHDLAPPGVSASAVMVVTFQWLSNVIYKKSKKFSCNQIYFHFRLHRQQI